MNTKNKPAILTLLLAINYNIYAQVNSNVVKAIAYQQEISGGNIPVEADGRPMRKAADTVFFLVIETKGTKYVQPASACRMGAGYGLILTDSTNNTTAALQMDRWQTMQPAKGNRLWRYELTPLNGTTMHCADSAKGFAVFFKHGSKMLKVLVKEIITLAPQLRP